MIDKRPHIGGNCYTDEVEGIIVHKYGPHVFHTDSKRIWDYVNRFADFNHFVNRPKVNYRCKIYSFPINLMTLYQLWGVKTPEEAISKLEQERVPISDPKNLLHLSILNSTSLDLNLFGYISKILEDTFHPETTCISKHNLFRAGTKISISVPLSNLLEASLA